jgi:hypothetical protein
VELKVDKVHPNLECLVLLVVKMGICSVKMDRSNKDHKEKLWVVRVTT